MPALSLPEGSRVAASRDQVSCDLAGEAAILNLKSGVYFGLDPVGARVWSLLQNPLTLAEICDALSQEYDVERGRLEADLRELISDLTEHGLVRIAE
ncbi:MAG: PqqD family protein [Candidatus Binataceae bacterium]